jgi:energy-coupling factor transporter transmembrane protein EcfT
MEKALANIEDLAIAIKEYADCKIEAVKLNVAEKSSSVLANVIAAVVVAGIFFFFIIFGSVALAIGLGILLGKMWLGFLIVAFLYLLAGFVFWKARIKFIQFPLMNAFVSQLFTNEHEED